MPKKNYDIVLVEWVDAEEKVAVRQEALPCDA